MMRPCSQKVWTPLPYLGLNFQMVIIKICLWYCFEYFILISFFLHSFGQMNESWNTFSGVVVLKSCNCCRKDYIWIFWLTVVQSPLWRRRTLWISRQFRTRLPIQCHETRGPWTSWKPVQLTETLNIGIYCSVLWTSWISHLIFTGRYAYSVGAKSKCFPFTFCTKHFHSCVVVTHSNDVVCHY